MFSRQPHSERTRAAHPLPAPNGLCATSNRFAGEFVYTGWMPALLFRCPTTKMLVQHWTQDEKDSEDDYEGVTCPACTGTHFVNSQGKVLGSTRNRLSAASRTNTMLKERGEVRGEAVGVADIASPELFDRQRSRPRRADVSTGAGIIRREVKPCSAGRRNVTDGDSPNSATEKRPSSQKP